MEDVKLNEIPGEPYMMDVTQSVSQQSIDEDITDGSTTYSTDAAVTDSFISPVEEGDAIHEGFFGDIVNKIKDNMAKRNKELKDQRDKAKSAKLQADKLQTSIENRIGR